MIEEFDLFQSLDFGIGTHLFCVGIRGHANFNAPCPVCGGTKTINVKGFDIPCGYCSISNNKRKDLQYLVLRDYSVDEYIINKITLSGSETKSEYKDGGYPKLSVCELTGFCKRKSPYTTVLYKNFSYLDKSFVDRVVTPEKVAELYDHFDGVYTARSLCDRVCNVFHDYQRELLREFNDVHHTSHEYPFER